jgi:hypothetical protein
MPPLGSEDLQRALSGRRRGSLVTRVRASRGSRQTWAVAASAAVAPLVGGHPVGSTALDWLWSAALAALGAYLGVRSKRVPLLAAAAVAVLAARTGPALAFGALSMAMGVLSTRHLRRRAPFARGAAGGSAVVSLLATSDHASAPVVGVVVAAVALLLWTSGYRNAREGERRWLRFGLAGAAVLAAAASGLALVGVLDKSGLVDAGTLELQAGLAAARAGDASGAAAHFARVEAALSDARRDIGRWGALGRAVPITAQHVDAVTSVLADVERATAAAGRVATIADDNLAVTAGSMDVEALAALEPPLRRAAEAFDAVVDEIEHQLEGPLLPPLVDRLHRIEDQAGRGRDEAAVGAEAARTVPGVLGRDGLRRYLVVFTSPAEARGRFGFPSSFAEVTFEHGRIRLGEHASTSQTFGATRYQQDAFDRGAPELRPYLDFGATRTLLSATISPDFPTVARVLAEMWEQSGRAHLDGVVRMDPSSLARLLRFTGPVAVAGRAAPLTADNVEQFLLVDQYREFAGGRTQAPRREVLDEVARVTFERLETANLPKPRTLIDIFGPMAREQHLDVALFDRSAQDLVRTAELDGSFAAPAVDGLAVTTVNRLGNKIDAFLERSISYRGTVDDGQLDAEVEVELRNGAPASGLPDYIIGSTLTPAPPRGTNRTSVLVYTAVPARSAEIDGVEVPITSTLAGGWYLHQLVVDIPPGASSTISMHLVGALPAGPYQLVLEPGGASGPDRFDVQLAVDGRSVRHRGRDLAPAVVD